MKDEERAVGQEAESPAGPRHGRVDVARQRVGRIGVEPVEDQDLEFAPFGGGEDRGIIFLALNANIKRQFEFIQRSYVNDGNAFRQGFDEDPITGRGGRMVIQGERGKAPIVCSLPQFVEMRGGEYFFVPSLEAIRWIASDRSQADASGRSS